VDAERFRLVGAPADRLRILGNAKFDSLTARAAPALKEEIAEKLDIKDGDRVLVAGSTHEGEEEIVFRVYHRLLETYPDLRLIIVPRHIERGPEVLALARGNGFRDAIMMKEILAGRRPSGERIMVIDVIGELFKVYSVATVVFCGGSLVPRGGQNILEAAAWGKVVFYGPFMDDFGDEKVLLEKTGAGITVNDGETLYRGIVGVLSNPRLSEERGAAARDMVAANMGASKRYAELIRQALNSNF
jgi:3-deoxy-D-manno-octulosonic-acid transferase